MFNGAWLNVNTDDSSSNFVLQEVSIIGHISVVDLNVNMIEDVEVVRSLVFLIEYTSVMLISLLINKTSNWESSSAYIHILKILETESHWHVVNNPMMLVVKCHGSLEQSKLCQIIGASTSVFLCVANQTAFFFLQECHLVWTWTNTFTEQNLSEIFDR